jgi:hypothetical protein
MVRWYQQEAVPRNGGRDIVRTRRPAIVSAGIDGCVCPYFVVPSLREAEGRLYHRRGADRVVWRRDGRDSVGRLRLLAVKIVCNFYNAAIGVNGGRVNCYRWPKQAISRLANSFKRNRAGSQAKECQAKEHIRPPPRWRPRSRLGLIRVGHGQHSAASRQQAS